MLRASCQFLAALLIATFASGFATGQIVQTDFVADLTEGYIILGGIQGTGSSATATAEFTLTQDLADPSNNTLSYLMTFQNVDLDGAQTADILDNITALHIHDTTQCAPTFSQCQEGIDTAGTIHLLNIFGLPRNDDADVVVDPVASTISGLWDVGDTSAAGTPVPTLDISSPQVISTLLNGEAAIFVHTNEIPTAASGGALLTVPEPTGLGMLLFGLAGVAGIVRRRR